jgi:hypothetical protein
MMGPFDVARGTHQLSNNPEHPGADYNDVRRYLDTLLIHGEIISIVY